MMELLISGDYFGTFVFAVTGGLAAAEKRLDLGGFILLAFVTGVGGGTMRDLILIRGSVFWAVEPVYLVICIAGALVAFFGSQRLSRLGPTLVWADAVGLAVFAVIGAGIAVHHDAKPLTAILMGVLTATGGGVIREIIRNELPLMLQRDLYMTSALAGSAVVVALMQIGTPSWLVLAAGFLVGLATRSAGLLFDLHLPSHRDKPTATDGSAGS